MALTYNIIHYNELHKDQLYALLSLRSEVFVVEQSCHYQDLDFYDQHSHHILAYSESALVGCARIVPPKLKREQPSIGRYALKGIARGAGEGRRLFAYAIERCLEIYPNQTIYIQAQHQLEALYKSFGFTTISEIYLEAGIDHVDMLLAPDAKTAHAEH